MRGDPIGGVMWIDSKEQSTYFAKRTIVFTLLFRKKVKTS